jgi:hypothetical protein
VWKFEKKCHFPLPTGIRNPDHPARSLVSIPTTLIQLPESCVIRSKAECVH